MLLLLCSQPIIAHLDYCSNLLTGFPASVLCPLQFIPQDRQKDYLKHFYFLSESQIISPLFSIPFSGFSLFSKENAKSIFCPGLSDHSIAPCTPDPSLNQTCLCLRPLHVLPFAWNAILCIIACLPPSLPSSLYLYDQSLP